MRFLRPLWDSSIGSLDGPNFSVLRFFLKSSISFVNAADRIPAVKPCGGMLPFQQAECEVYMPFFLQDVVDIDGCVGCGCVDRRNDEGEL